VSACSGLQPVWLLFVSSPPGSSIAPAQNSMTSEAGRAAATVGPYRFDRASTEIIELIAHLRPRKQGPSGGQSPSGIATIRLHTARPVGARQETWREGVLCP